MKPAGAPLSNRARLCRQTEPPLRAEGKESLITSVRHIGTWTLREVTSRWTEYCVASNTIQAEMRARVRKEVALTYPMLAELSVNGNRPIATAVRLP